MVRFLLFLDGLIFRKKSYAIALMYHRIGRPGKFSVSTGELRSQILDLKARGFTFVHAEDLVLWRPEMGRKCAITFDDGYRDNAELKSLDVPVTIFIATDPLEAEVGCPRDQLDPQGLVLSLRNSLHVRFGGHGVTHRRWTRIGSQELNTELTESSKKIEEWWGQPVTTCAYPKGSSNPLVRSQVSGHYKSAFLADGGPILRPIEDPYSIPRVGIFGAISLPMFQLRTSAIFALLLPLYFLWKKFLRP